MDKACEAKNLPGGASYFCEGTGTSRLDPLGTDLTTPVLCNACTSLRHTLAELAEGEQDERTAQVAEADRIYGMGANAA